MARNKLLKEIIREIYGDNYIAVFWKRIDIIGDIAIIKKPFDLNIEKLKPLAEELVRRMTNIKSVWAAVSPIHGEHRIRKYVHLAGEKKYITNYKEYGCIFRVDITKTFITPRLSYEHYRVAKMVKEDEVVTNMYAGVGLFSIIIAKFAKPRKVYSIDINPIAYELMKHNIKINKVENIVVPILGDAAKIIEKSLTNTSTRVLMPLPELFKEHFRYAVQALVDEGYIHVYIHVFVPKGETTNKAAIDFAKPIVERYTKDYRIENTRVVRGVGPRKYQVVLDLWIKKV